MINSGVKFWSCRDQLREDPKTLFHMDIHLSLKSLSPGFTDKA